jgi:hypothetical protein
MNSRIGWSSAAPLPFFLGLQTRTAYRDWAYARAWLRRELDRDT